MKVVLHEQEDIELKDFDDPEFLVERRDPEAHFSAMEMFATSLGICTYSMLASYAEQIEADTDDLSIRIRWSYAENQRLRIDNIDMGILWPGLPPSRLEAAQRAASHCTLHNTLAVPPKVMTEVTI